MTKGRVLITSRDRQVVGSHANYSVHLLGISGKDAERLLLQLHGVDSTKTWETPLEHPEYPAIQKIIKELQAFPLAIDQAAAFMRENSPITFEEYLEYLKLRSQDRELLMRFKEALPKHPDSVMTTWELSLRYLENQYPRASRILQLLGFMSHSEIPEVLLKEATKAIPW